MEPKQRVKKIVKDMVELSLVKGETECKEIAGNKIHRGGVRGRKNVRKKGEKKKGILGDVSSGQDGLKE